MFIKSRLKKLYRKISFRLNTIEHKGEFPPSRQNVRPPKWGKREIWRHPKLSEFNPPKNFSKVELGAGDKKLEGWINVDISDEFKPEIVCDINSGLPFKNDSIGEVRAFSVLEHLDETIDCLNEIWRVCADGAILCIYVPHCRSTMGVADPTHKKLFNEESFQYFCRNGNHYRLHESYEIKCCFDLIEETIYHHYRSGHIKVRLRAIKNHN